MTVHEKETTPGSAELDLLPGFSWPVLRAFSDALATATFCEGDTLYDHESAYTHAQGRAALEYRYRIQVSKPKRQASTAGSNEESAGVFEANWKTPLVYDLYDRATGEAEQCLTTRQGNLITTLERGDIHILSARQCPPTPRSLKNLRTNIKGIDANAVRSCLEKGGGDLAFAVPYDPINKVSREKQLMLDAPLKRRLQARVVELSLTEAGIPAPEEYFPTISIRMFVFDGIDESQVVEALKSALYRPAKDAKKDNFKPSRHGLLISK